MWRTGRSVSATWLGLESVGSQSMSLETGSIDLSVSLLCSSGETYYISNSNLRNLQDERKCVTSSATFSEAVVYFLVAVRRADNLPNQSNNWWASVICQQDLEWESGIEPIQVLACAASLRNVFFVNYKLAQTTSRRETDAAF